MKNLLAILMISLLLVSPASAQLPPLMLFDGLDIGDHNPGDIVTITYSIYAPGVTEPITPTLDFLPDSGLEFVDIAWSGTTAYDDHPITIYARFKINEAARANGFYYNVLAVVDDHRGNVAYTNTQFRNGRAPTQWYVNLPYLTS